MAGLLDAGAITGIVVALLYTAGWSYAYHYFSLFHISLTELGITKDTLFIYSLWVLTDSIPALVSCFGTIGLYFLLRFVWRKKAVVEQVDPAEGEGDEPVQVVRHPVWLWVLTLVARRSISSCCSSFFIISVLKRGGMIFFSSREMIFLPIHGSRSG